MSSGDLYPVLAPGHVLRRLESPYVYNIPDDEMYELDDEAFEFLTVCDGKHPFSGAIKNPEDREAIEYMADEGIIRMNEFPSQRKIEVKKSPIPSLRYLLFNITNRCNLECKHCYLGRSGTAEIEPDLFEKTVSGFEDMGGLKLMVSGGEPLLHSRFGELMEVLPSYELRMMVISNGTLIGREEARFLSGHVNEVQVSIDGITSHDMIRGKGSYKRAMSGISHLLNSGVSVSIATMVHRYNAEEFDEMQKVFSDMNILSWRVDVPCVAGNLAANPEFSLDMEHSSMLLKYGFGAGAHESTGNYTCGSHLCAVSPEGKVSRCGFFEDEPAGDANDLQTAWKRLCETHLWTLDRLECSECKVIRECRGGCRFRARQYKGILAPDPLLCHAHGVLDFL